MSDIFSAHLASHRFSFRARLAALIASVFVVGSAVLLTGQYFLVRHLLGNELAIFTTVVDSTNDISVSYPDNLPTIIRDEDGLHLTIDTETTNLAFAQQSAQISANVLRQLVQWSLGTLALSTALAAGASWWLSKRSLGRIADITATAQAINHTDLHRRLSLPGPNDEIKELGDTIDGMLDRISDAFERQDRFIAGASHELRTPLATTRTVLEIPLEQGRVPEDLEPAIRAALDANQRSEQLIAALLDLARSKRTHPSPPRHPAALASPSRHPAALASPSRHPAALEEGSQDLFNLEQLVTARKSEIEKRNIRVETHQDITRISADQNLLLLAVGNLLDNAIKHNNVGGNVYISTGEDKDTKWIEISNDGANLTETNLEELKEPFHRGTQSRLTGDGLGLGLALAESAATALNGKLTLCARAPHEGGGLKARLTFPSN